VGEEEGEVALQEDCQERDRLEQEHVVALTEWINAGGEDRAKATNPAVIAAAIKVSAALKAMNEHRQNHDC
jgi:hypothetical protein